MDAMSFLRSAALVLLGGAAGTLGRHAVGTAWSDTSTWPWPTFVVNLLGSLFLGALVARSRPDQPARLLLGTGLLGGFTTYSAFAVETDRLVREDHLALAALYPVATVVLGAAAALVGMIVARRP